MARRPGGQGGTGHHPGRELDRRPRRRPAQPAAPHQAQDRGRALPAGRALPGGAAGRVAEGHQDRQEPRPGAGAVPQLPEEAPHRAAGPCRHGGRGARDRRDRRQERRRHRLVAGRPDLRAEGSGQEHRGCRPQHHAHAGVLARGGHARLAHRALHDGLPVPGEERAGRALQGAGRLRDQRRQHREARELPVAARISSRRSSMPRSRAIPSSAACSWRWRSCGFFSEEFKMLGTFPANPFRRKGWEAPTRPGT